MAFGLRGAGGGRCTAAPGGRGAAQVRCARQHQTSHTRGVSGRGTKERQRLISLLERR